MILIVGQEMMRRKITGAVLAMLVLAYLAGFLIVRRTHYNRGRTLVPDENGVYSTSYDFEETEFWLNPGGTDRTVQHALFIIFWPAGQIDHMITGREYNLTDEREIDMSRNCPTKQCTLSAGAAEA